jgi:hypothetical protein
MAFQSGAFQSPGFQQIGVVVGAGRPKARPAKRKKYILPDDTLIEATDAEVREIAMALAQRAEIVERATNELARQSTRRAKRVIARVGEALQSPEPPPQALLVDVVLAWLLGRIPLAPDLLIPARSIESLRAEFATYAEAGAVAMRYRRALIIKAIERIIVAQLLGELNASRRRVSAGPRGGEVVREPDD